MEPQLTKVPYGLWSSPLIPQGLGSQLRLANPQFDSDGKSLLWLEGRSGKGVLVAQPQAEANLELSEELWVRGGVGYGGGEYHIRDGLLVFAEKDGRLYRRRLGFERPVPLIPAFGSAAA